MVKPAKSTAESSSSAAAPEKSAVAGNKRKRAEETDGAASSSSVGMRFCDRVHSNPEFDKFTAVLCSSATAQAFLVSLLQAAAAPSGTVAYTNKQRVLIFGSRGMTARYRHLMEDIKSLVPHHKRESKVGLFVLLNCGYNCRFRQRGFCRGRCSTPACTPILRR